MSGDKLRVNPGYALGQLLRAINSSGETADAKVTQWLRVLTGMFSGELDHGSRAPVADTPAWVTLEVAHGGFATGVFLAGGPLQPHEVELLRRVDRPDGANERAALNTYYLSDAGRTELDELLTTGCYRVTVPEEAALLVVAWLIRRSESDLVETILNAISPYFDRLRFYPVPSATPISSGDSLSVRSAADVVFSLRSRRPNRSIATMNEAIRVWTPLYDRAVELFLETVDGELPHIPRSETGGLARRPDGVPLVEGGWPCRYYPEGWPERARGLVEEYERERLIHQLSGKPEKAKENFARLRTCLLQCAEDPGALTGRDVGTIRKILASYVTKHGAPGSERLAGTRAAQSQMAAHPEHFKFAQVLANRLEARDSGRGIPDVDACLVPLTVDEAFSIDTQPGDDLPPGLVTKAERCLEAPVETLIDRGVVRSSEGLAILLPNMTAQIRGNQIDQPELRAVFEESYRAFRRRRSLLLLDLENQVRLEELPWIQALSPWVGDSETSRAFARVALVRAVTLAVKSFPQTILPNNLVRELIALASAAGERVPLVYELATDIFMGSFTASYLRSAQATAPVIAGTIYERYYGLPLERVVSIDDLEYRPNTTPTSPALAALCAELAGARDDSHRSVARNGTIIEQCQILTTHNLAPLIGGLNLIAELRPSLPEMARRCFACICLRMQLVSGDWRADLQAIKNNAYAWRQMMFLISLMDVDNAATFIDWTVEHFDSQRDDFKHRFGPVMLGLQLVASGGRFGQGGIDRVSGGRRFLGWSVGRHWLMPGSDSAAPD